MLKPHIHSLLAQQYAQQCLKAIGVSEDSPREVPQGDASCSLDMAWRDSGLEPLSMNAPAHVTKLASAADGAMLALKALMPQGKIPWLGRRLLGMRRLTHELRPAGLSSANGSCHFLQCADGWLALNLARDEDVELLPAWLESDVTGVGESLRQVVSGRSAPALLARGRLLGLPVSLNTAPPAQVEPWFTRAYVGQRLSTISAAPKVLDLSSLWAGPLASSLLAAAGGQVTRIEHPQRPDGARNGPAGFFHALNASKQTLKLDLKRADDREKFLHELESADIVIDAFRPRVWAQLDIEPTALVREHVGLSWLSITGYGLAQPQGNWVAFGDDAAVAAGLSWGGETMAQPRFYGDAIADPLTGIHAALLAWQSFRSGGGERLSVALRDVVAHVLAA